MYNRTGFDNRSLQSAVSPMGPSMQQYSCELYSSYLTKYFQSVILEGIHLPVFMATEATV